MCCEKKKIKKSNQNQAAHHFVFTFARARTLFLSGRKERSGAASFPQTTTKKKVECFGKGEIISLKLGHSKETASLLSLLCGGIENYNYIDNG